MAPQELGSKDGLDPQKEWVGEKIRILTLNYGLCMVSSIMHAFISGMLVVKLHMLIFPQRMRHN